MSNFTPEIYLMPDGVRKISWKETLEGVFRVGYTEKSTNNEDYSVSKTKATALAVISFIVAALALAIVTIALGALFSIPILTPLATAAIAAVAIGGALSQGALIATAVGVGALFFGGLIVGSFSADTLRVGNDV